MSRAKAVIVGLVIAASLIGAATAVAVTQSQARTAAVKVATWKSSCGNNGWVCTGVVVAGVTNRGGGQWNIEVTVFRERSSTKQVCQWGVDIGSGGNTQDVAGYCEAQHGGIAV